MQRSTQHPRRRAWLRRLIVVAVLAAVEAVFWLAAFAGFKKRKQALLDAIRRPGAGS